MGLADWLAKVLKTTLGGLVQGAWLNPADLEGEPGIAAVGLMTPSGSIQPWGTQEY